MIEQFMVNHKYKFLYYRIPKTGSTALLNWCFDLAGITVPKDQIHWYFSKDREAYGPSQQVINDNSYFKFTFIRNPWSRVVSAYLNKIVMLNKHNRRAKLVGQDVIKTVQENNNESVDFVRSITFAEFIKYLSMAPVSEMNHHWRPQSLLLKDVCLDFVGIMENMKNEFTHVRTKLNISLNIKKMNAMLYKNKYGECVSECSPMELRANYSFPYYRDFYTPELLEMVNEIYKEDHELHTVIKNKPLDQRSFPLE